MNMIEKMLVNAENYLPLKIEFSQWNDVNFNIHGSDWGFNTLSAWRITKDGKIIYGSNDKSDDDFIDILTGVSIISIYSQNLLFKVDPVFILSNEQKLEIFSTDTYEPWTFSLQETCYYCACPSEPAKFDPN